MTKTILFTLATSIALSAPAYALSLDEINNAAVPAGGGDGPSAPVVKLQILLDRFHASPGVIDGYMGDNVRSAIRAAERMAGLPEDGKIDDDLWQKLSADTSKVMQSYTITQDDIADLNDALPDDYAKLAEMDWFGYTSVQERLAERFHMDQDLLKLLNDDREFAVGEKIAVANVQGATSYTAERVVIDKQRQRAFVHGEGSIQASYPVTVGSDQLPSPNGTVEVTAVAVEPTYSYKPDKNFQQGDNTEQLTLPPGPNGPVGSVWIDLSKPTYGIHGTSDPASIAKTASHGCVRMTNWDAMELAQNVSVGVTVEFLQ